MKNDKQIVLPT